MDSPLKWLALFAIVVGLGVGAVSQQATLYALYKTHIKPDPPPPPQPDMSDYIELQPIVEEAPEPGTFQVGSIVYVAGKQDVLGWDETEIQLHYTWEGSGETDRQSETWTVTHGTKVKVLDIKKGRGGTWYRVETQAQFRHRGWLLGHYLRASKPAESDESKEWGQAKEDVAKRREAQKKEAERQRKLLEEARKRRAGS